MVSVHVYVCERETERGSERKKPEVEREGESEKEARGLSIACKTILPPVALTQRNALVTLQSSQTFALRELLCLHKKTAASLLSAWCSVNVPLLILCRSLVVTLVVLIIKCSYVRFGPLLWHNQKLGSNEERVRVCLFVCVWMLVCFCLFVCVWEMWWACFCVCLFVHLFVCMCVCVLEMLCATLSSSFHPFKQVTEAN